MEAFGTLVRILASQSGKMLNYSEISNTICISLATVKNYLYYLEKTFIIQKVSPFFRNARKEITKSPVIYFYDLGLRNFSAGNFGRLDRQEDKGFIFQNFVLNILKEKNEYSGTKINFWRTKDKAEVDFVLDRGKEILPIEVKFGEMKKVTVERSLRSFIEKYNPKGALVITKNFKKETTLKKTKIIFMPFWESIVKEIF